jgi:hypothetical protein
MRYPVVILVGALALSVMLGCTSKEEPAATEPAAAPAEEASAETEAQPAKEEPAEQAAAPEPAALTNGLLLAYSQFQVVDGKATAKPGPARLDILTYDGGEWKTETVEDGQSNVFHKAMTLTPRDQPPGILTLGGTGAYVKLWRRNGGSLQSTTLWHEEFGGKFNRMRDAEVADLYGDGSISIAVATHDQGVVAVLRQKGN